MVAIAIIVAALGALARHVAYAVPAHVFGARAVHIILARPAGDHVAKVRFDRTVGATKAVVVVIIGAARFVGVPRTEVRAISAAGVLVEPHAAPRLQRRACTAQRACGRPTVEADRPTLLLPHADLLAPEQRSSVFVCAGAPEKA